MITTGQKKCCTADTDDNTSINNDTINNKGSNNNKSNINHFNCSKKLKINNDAIKINHNKNDNYNNLHIEKVLVITSIANTTATAKIITSITKSMYMQSAEKAVAATPISLASKTVAGQHQQQLWQRKHQQQ